MSEYVTWQMVRRLAKIATSNKLSPWQKDKVSSGEMGLVKAYEIATSEKSPKKTKREIRAALKSARANMEKEKIEVLEWVLGK